MNGIPLPQNQITTEDFEEAVLQEVMSQTPKFQKAVYRGKLSDSDDVIDFTMNQPNVMPRLNDRILDKEKSFYLDMTGTPTSINNVQTLLKLSPRDMTATAVENLKYFTVPKKGKQYHTTTYWIVGDLNCIKSRTLLLDALEHLVSDDEVGPLFLLIFLYMLQKLESDVRVSFLPNVNGDKKGLLNKIVLAAQQELPPEKSLNLVLSLLRGDKAARQLENKEKLDIPVSSHLFMIDFKNYYITHILII